MLAVDLRLDAEPIQTSHVSDFSFLSPLVPTELFTAYWRFAAERQRVFLRRLEALPAPWTSDRLLTEHKFTNAYRASDRVSQYLIRHVVYRGDPSCRENFFRTILFKLFNKIETWELLEQEFGTLSFANYSFKAYDKILTSALNKRRIYSGAYIMPAGGTGKKHRLHLRLLEKMMNDDLPQKLSNAPSMQRAFTLLRAYPSIGDFLGYQFVTDLNYGTLTDFDEMEFVVAGSGARDGIKKCFKRLAGRSEADVIRVIAERQEECLTATGVRLPTLWGRKLQLIDCQNLFCEIDKYARKAYPELRGHSKRSRIKQKFKPSLKPVELWYPPKWQINDRIDETPARIPS
jgi:hypothetical protein